MSDILLEIKRIFFENINDESKLVFSLGSNLSVLNLDSITFIKIIVCIEEAFNFEFDDEMLLFTAFPTVKSIIEYVESKISIGVKNSI